MVVTKPSPLGNIVLSVKPHQDISKTTEKKNTLTMELYNLAHCSIYNGILSQKKKIMTTRPDNNHTAYSIFLT